MAWWSSKDIKEPSVLRWGNWGPDKPSDSIKTTQIGSYPEPWLRDSKFRFHNQGASVGIIPLAFLIVLVGSNVAYQYCSSFTKEKMKTFSLTKTTQGELSLYLALWLTLNSTGHCWSRAVVVIPFSGSWFKRAMIFNFNWVSFASLFFLKLNRYSAANKIPEGVC